MKFLIWFGCLFCAGLLMTLSKNVSGVELGPLAKTFLAVTACGGAVALCKLYNRHKNDKNDKQ